MVRFRIEVSEHLSDDSDFAVGVDGDIERRVFILLMPFSRATADLASNIPAFLGKLGEEE